MPNSSFRHPAALARPGPRRIPGRRIKSDRSATRIRSSARSIRTHVRRLISRSLIRTYNKVLVPRFGPRHERWQPAESSIYEPEPALFTNGVGYTVSQGYGVYGEQIGYAHGVVDAAEAVYMAKNWDMLNQNIDPNTELTYTTAVVVEGANLPAAERTPVNHGDFLIPGGIGGRSGFSAYWDQYYATNPFDNYTGPSAEDRGAVVYRLCGAGRIRR